MVYFERGDLKSKIREKKLFEYIEVFLMQFYISNTKIYKIIHKLLDLKVLQNIGNQLNYSTLINGKPKQSEKQKEAPADAPFDREQFNELIKTDLEYDTRKNKWLQK
jgi:hypothetical protein